jgi:PKD repeat protein
MTMGRMERFLLVLALAILASAALLILGPTSADAADLRGFQDMPLAMNVTVDPGGAVDGWRWDFEGDGTYDWYSIMGPNATHTFDVNGTFNAVLRAELSNGTNRTWTFVVEILPDILPPVVFIHGYPEGYVTTDRLTPVDLHGSASDDGSIAFYQWDFDGDGEFDWKSVLNVSTQHLFTELGTYTVVLRATDDQGAVGIAELQVIVVNLAPVIQRTPRYSSFEPEVNMTIKGEDPDGTIASVTWDFGDGTDPITTVTLNVTHTFPHYGFFQVMVEVLDNEGGSSTDQFLVEIDEGHPYTPPKVSAGEDVETMVGLVVQFEATPTEGTLAIVSYQWDLDGDGELESDGRAQSYSYSANGTYVVRIKVVDAGGWFAEDILNVTVLAEHNDPPVPRPSVEQWVKPGRNLHFEQESSDPDGSIVLYQWDFDGDGLFDYADANEGNTTHVYPEEGLFVAVLQVTDNRGEVSSTSVTIKVSWDAPSDDGFDDTKGAAICCASIVIVLVLLTYWTLRKTMASPRKDGGRVPPSDEGSVEEEVGKEEGKGDRTNDVVDGDEDEGEGERDPEVG